MLLSFVCLVSFRTAFAFALRVDDCRSKKVLKKVIIFCKKEFQDKVATSYFLLRNFKYV